MNVATLTLGLALIAPGAPAVDTLAEKAAMAQRSGRSSWLAWSVPSATDGVACCGNGRSRDSRTCSLSTTSYGTTMSNDDGPMVDPTLMVYAHIDAKGIDKIRVFSSSCRVDRAGETVQDLANISPADSVSYLESLVKVSEAERATKRRSEGALMAIAMHDDKSADGALERVARERAEQGDSHLWHDAAWHPDEPLLDLGELQSHGHAGWRAAVPVLRKLALPVIRGCGVPAEDAEDVLAETLAALIQPDARAQRPLDALLVAEQLPALCKVIARRRSADFLRRCFAEKRAVNMEVAIDSMDNGGVATAMAVVAPEFDLHDILEQSADAVSPAQWDLITRLIIHPSDTHTSLIADERLMSALFIDPQSSEATRRRRLHEALDLALKQIRHHLDLP